MAACEFSNTSDYVVRRNVSLLLSVLSSRELVKLCFDLGPRQYSISKQACRELEKRLLKRQKTG